MTQPNEKLDIAQRIALAPDQQALRAALTDLWKKVLPDEKDKSLRCIYGEASETLVAQDAATSEAFTTLKKNILRALERIIANLIAQKNSRAQVDEEPAQPIVDQKARDFNEHFVATKHLPHLAHATLFHLRTFLSAQPELGSLRYPHASALWDAYITRITTDHKDVYAKLKQLESTCAADNHDEWGTSENGTAALNLIRPIIEQDVGSFEHEEKFENAGRKPTVGQGKASVLRQLKETKNVSAFKQNNYLKEAAHIFIIDPTIIETGLHSLRDGQPASHIIASIESAMEHRADQRAHIGTADALFMLAAINQHLITLTDIGQALRDMYAGKSANALEAGQSTSLTVYTSLVNEEVNVFKTKINGTKAVDHVDDIRTRFESIRVNLKHLDGLKQADAIKRLKPTFVGSISDCASTASKTICAHLRKQGALNNADVQQQLEDNVRMFNFTKQLLQICGITARPRDIAIEVINEIDKQLDQIRKFIRQAGKDVDLKEVYKGMQRILLHALEALDLDGLTDQTTKSGSDPEGRRCEMLKL